MKQLMQKAKNGFSVTLNKSGLQAVFDTNTPVKIENCMGASVVISARNNAVTFETIIPESRIPFRWIFEVNSDGSIHQSKTLAQNLEGLISQLRVDLNGKL